MKGVNLLLVVEDIDAGTWCVVRVKNAITRTIRDDFSFKATATRWARSKAEEYGVALAIQDRMLLP